MIKEERERDTREQKDKNIKLTTRKERKKERKTERKKDRKKERKERGYLKDGEIVIVEMEDLVVTWSIHKKKKTNILIAKRPKKKKDPGNRGH